VFILEILGSTCRCLEGELFIFKFHVEKPVALLSLLNVNKGRNKTNKCKDLKKK
jgi:hypothetical protein